MYALLPHRLADALRDAAMRLAVDDQRIDAAADIVDRGIAGDRRPAGLGIDLDLADRRSRSETPGRASRCRRRRRGRPSSSGGRARAASFASSRKSKLRLLRGDEKRPSLNSTSSTGASSTQRGDLLALGDQLGRGLGDHRRGVAHRAAGMRAAADADDVGVADDDVDVSHRHREQVGRPPGRSSSRGPGRSAGCRSRRRPRRSGVTVISVRSCGEPIEDST